MNRSADHLLDVASIILYLGKDRVAQSHQQQGEGEIGHGRRPQQRAQQSREPGVGSRKQAQTGKQAGNDGLGSWGLRRAQAKMDDRGA